MGKDFIGFQAYIIATIMSSLRTDVKNYGDPYAEEPMYICRGKRLWKLVEQLRDGLKSESNSVNAVAGFSEDPAVCKRFGARGHEETDGPPATYIASIHDYKEQYPSLQPIQYDDEKWMKAHPEVVEVCQTLSKSFYEKGGIKLASEEERIGSAKCHKDEKEWVVLGESEVKPLSLKREYEIGEEKHEYKAQGTLNVYLTERELTRLGVDIPDGWSGHYLPEVTKAMDEAKKFLEETLPSDLPVEQTRLYYCDIHDRLVNMWDSQEHKDNRAHCFQHSSLHPKGPEMKEFKHPKSYPVGW